MDTLECDHPAWWSLWKRWSLWALNKDCLLIYLLIIQIVQSAINGEASKTTDIACWIFNDSNTIPTKIDPKNVLPPSPMKTLAGLQLSVKNPSRLAERNNKFWFINIDAVINITDIVKANKPSRPSMKLKILINSVPINTIAIIKIENIKPEFDDQLDLINGDKNTSAETVIIWKNILIKGETSLWSSIKPIMASGKQTSGVIKDVWKLDKAVKQTKTIPAPLGVDSLWELRLLGLSIKSFLSVGIKSFIEVTLKRKYNISKIAICYKDKVLEVLVIIYQNNIKMIFYIVLKVLSSEETTLSILSSVK